MMKFVLKFEGGYTDIDPGGTNYGIMQANYDSYRVSHNLKKQSVRYITMDEVYDLYYYKYYLPSGSDTLQPCLSFVHFDTAVNCGIGQSEKFIKKVRMIPDKDNAIKYISLRDQLYRWIAKYRDKQRFLQGWLNRDKEIKLIINTL
jgi:lysozyme family protein